MGLVVLFLVLIFLHGLVSARVEKTLLTAPIIFTLAGMGAFFADPQWAGWSGTREVFLHVAEAGLVLLLFTDASRTSLGMLRRIRNLPVRLLSTGMLLTILLGGAAALVVFPQFTIWEAGILAAILAPTDAGLGQIIVTSPKVPMKIRQGLNVEAGLNDGLSVPFLLFFMALTGTAEERGQTASLTTFIGEQLGYGTLMGAGIGLLGGFLLGQASRRKTIADSWLQLAVVVLPLLCAVASEAAGASMFIAAFVAGLAVQVGFKDAGKHSVEFTEEWGQFLNLSVFFLFGFICARDWHGFAWRHLVYAVLSLTVIRILPVGVALMGTGFSRATIWFMGWFGPRGLASIVLGLVFLEQASHVPAQAEIRAAVMMTVLLSILAHGLSATPGMNCYARAVARLPETAPELGQPGEAKLE